MRSGFGILAVAATLCASGCEFFGGENDDDELGDSGDTGDPDTGEDPPPSQGFRVFPKFMVQDVPAIVTIASDGVSSVACELDGASEGGYVCDAGGLSNGALATIVVERDGFDMAVRQPAVSFNQIVPLDVHLAVEGGPTGTWSACAGVGEFATCDELCAATAGTCGVSSCATEQPEWPLATYETFFGPECEELVDSIVDTCGVELPGAGVESLRCCC